MPDVPEEVFDVSRIRGATAKWPKPRKSPKLEPDHPPTLPDFHDGPFEPIEGWSEEQLTFLKADEPSSFRMDSPGKTPESSKPGGDAGVSDEEIGYEGER